jgi:histidine triad (HIT) family protein
MEDSVFTKIINGEIPCHKVHEDELTLAFMTINPVFPGHVLVIPKKQIDQFDDMPDEDYIAVFATVKKVSKRIKEVYSPKRVIVSVMGYDVPHAHVHVMPCDSASGYIKRVAEQLDEIKNDSTPEPDHTQLAEIAQKLAF